MKFYETMNKQKCTYFSIFLVPGNYNAERNPGYKG